MPYKSKEARKKYYDENKDEINRKRREYSKRPEVRERVRKQDKIWRENNREKANKLSRESKKRYEDKCKKLVFDHYGRKCECCDENNEAFLSIDHINGGGRKHRRKITEKICIWLVKNNFPKEFQVLCFNCNWGKYQNNGICPHKE